MDWLHTSVLVFPALPPLTVFSSSLLSGLSGPGSHDECGTGPGSGSCHYPVTIYYSLSLGTINPGPGNRDLSVLHYQDLPMFPFLSDTWWVHAHTHTLSVWAFRSFFCVFYAFCCTTSNTLINVSLTQLIAALFTCTFASSHSQTLTFLQNTVWTVFDRHQRRHNAASALIIEGKQVCCFCLCVCACHSELC